MVENYDSELVTLPIVEPEDIYFREAVFNLAFAKLIPNLPVNSQHKSDPEAVKDIVVAMSSSYTRDQAKDQAKMKPPTAKVVAWFVDSERFHNFKIWSKNTTKEDKLKEFTGKLIKKNEYHTITHKGLQEAGMTQGKVVRAEYEFQKHIIIVSFDLEMIKTMPENQETRDGTKIKEPTDTDATAEATTAKKSQAQAEIEAGNKIFETLNSWLKKTLYD